jgi:dihydrolipoamide dehydrogenase
VPQAIREGFVAGNNAAGGAAAPLGDALQAGGSFTDPEYASVGLTEDRARVQLDVVTSIVDLRSATRSIIDGQTRGFCKLVVDRDTHRIVGCHVVGDRAVDITQTATIAMAADMGVEELARVPFAFPTYAGVLARAAASATRALKDSPEVRSAGDARVDLPV